MVFGFCPTVGILPPAQAAAGCDRGKGKTATVFSSELKKDGGVSGQVRSPINCSPHRRAKKMAATGTTATARADRPDPRRQEATPGGGRAPATGRGRRFRARTNARREIVAVEFGDGHVCRSRRSSCRWRGCAGRRSSRAGPRRLGTHLTGPLRRTSSLVTMERAVADEALFRSRRTSATARSRLRSGRSYPICLLRCGAALRRSVNAESDGRDFRWNRFWRVLKSAGRGIAVGVGRLATAQKQDGEQGKQPPSDWYILGCHREAGLG